MAWLQDLRCIETLRHLGLVLYSPGYRKLTDFEEFAILEVVVEKPSIYLREICKHINSLTGSVITESAVCRFLQRNNFSHKTLRNIARHILREYFKEECRSYAPEMMVFVDETGCDRRSSTRKFGYALKGITPETK